jgi:uncharacterized protein YggU (UPF0235/DUF167 family)
VTGPVAGDARVGGAGDPVASPPASPAWVRTVPGGAVVRVRLQPGSRQSGVAGTQGVLRLRVQQPPVDGRANEAARSLLASLLDVPASRVRLLRGATSREKEFLVEGMGAAQVVERLTRSVRR